MATVTANSNVFNGEQRNFLDETGIITVERLTLDGHRCIFFLYYPHPSCMIPESATGSLRTIKFFVVGNPMKWYQKIVIVSIPLVLMTGVTLKGFSFENVMSGTSYEKNVVIERIVEYLKGKNVDMHEERLKSVVHTVYEQSQQYDLDYRLALAVIKVESNFQDDVVSRKGARGLFQIKPSLAKYIAKDAGVTFSGADCLHESEKNIKLGVYHLSKLLGDFKSVSTALHAYNVGTGKLKGRSAQKAEPKNSFTKKVLKEYQKNIAVLPEGE